ncbi:hypothetical protein [Phycisphaera mikurensis]|uniref:RNA polymerase sigma-70 region 4 domain-containing protein n=1 Tax=Phycisphaera mikurensis (strain NBRC 102666 / KCTC 22515 / FYK2301M01) TaxID=1142394 RepID=I0IHB4_PHYMF|nr:hypothetical protein [Phycisphaera mikurensis]MBB6440901.1 DNA-directed RNA polymerase specialized sigma24 family protein [Phycisphaera mikurensis]BAM04652.1 hypothetical protein PSMK_24930 [Phycisphaera mikurensis NBRC 102666]
MERLTELERKILVGRFLGGKSMLELSTELDLAVRQLHGLCRRALRKLGDHR